MVKEGKNWPSESRQDKIVQLISINGEPVQAEDLTGEKIREVFEEPAVQFITIAIVLIIVGYLIYSVVVKR